jgi:flagellum-specific ATP synthase
MNEGALLEACQRQLEERSPLRWWGRVTRASGQLIESEGPFCAPGECCEIFAGPDDRFSGEVIGFRGSTVLSMLLERASGVHFGDRITTWGARPTFRVGEELLGRVVDATGEPLDGGPPYRARQRRSLHAPPPKPLERFQIQEPLGCGIRAIDGFLTCGRGQRLGIFGGSGVGKSLLIGMMARESEADLTVLALVGERGREVRDYLEKALGAEGIKRSVVIVSTSDQSPLLRIRAALAATTVAEYFREQGRHVLLVVDSLTRFAMAQREVGLAAGEPPTAKGYTPSVFALLAKLIERAGRLQNGSITAFYTVLMEADDQQDPLVDAARSLLDGHVMLDRRLAERNHYPAIAILDSLSRLASAVCQPSHLDKAQKLRRLLAAYVNAEDLIRVGAYQKGLDPTLDQAIAVMPELNAYLQQQVGERAPLDKNIAALLAIPL